jgi:hypothetical protein
MGRAFKIQKTVNELMNFDDFIDNFYDIGLLTAANHIWHIFIK